MQISYNSLYMEYMGMCRQQHKGPYVSNTEAYLVTIVQRSPHAPNKGSPNSEYDFENIAVT